MNYIYIYCDIMTEKKIMKVKITKQSEKKVVASIYYASRYITSVFGEKLSKINDHDYGLFIGIKVVAIFHSDEFDIETRGL